MTLIIVKKLPHSRSVAKALNSYGISLDESAFCSKCRKDSKEEPVLSLIVKYADQPEPRITKGTTYTDLNILYEFLHNKKIHVAENDREVPLKDYTDRLSYLLGVEINKKN